MKRITVLLVDDHTVVREGLRVLIEAGGDIEVVGEAKTGREAVQMFDDLRPEIVLMDIAMPSLNGVQATRQILKAHPSAKVLMLSAHAGLESLEDAVKVGARGYLLKQSSSSVIADAIRKLQEGQMFFNPAFTKRLKAEYRKSPTGIGLRKKKINLLTPREAELLQLIAEGQVNKQMAAKLEISVKTVEKHRQNLMEKLGIHDVAGLTRYAIAAGIIENSIQPTIVKT